MLKMVNKINKIDEKKREELFGNLKKIAFGAGTVMALSLPNANAIRVAEYNPFTQQPDLYRLQFNEWIDNTNYEVGNQLVDNDKLYICNTSGIQTGSFNDNISRWDLVNKQNFSFNIINDNVVIVIDEFQQMIVQQSIQINGDLIINGSLAVIN